MKEILPPGCKRCTRCTLVKSLDEFYNRRNVLDGKMSHCKECANRISKEPGEVHMERYFRRKFGITREEYNRMLEEQEGLCAVCQEPETMKHQGRMIGLAVDHCHTTGRVRALLCSACNQALGLLEENEGIARALLLYCHQNEPITFPEEETVLEEITEKLCSGCGIVKSLQEFIRDKSEKTGYTYKCKLCVYEKKKFRSKNSVIKQSFPEHLRQCKSCGEVKEIGLFYNPGKQWLVSRCKECWKEHVRATDPEKKKHYVLKKTYGITIEQYNWLLEQQGFVCRICHKPEIKTLNGELVSLSVDHSHEHGFVRGLLCVKCNIALGLLKEDSGRIQALLHYISRIAA